MMVTFRKKGKIGPVRTVHLPYLTIRTATFGAYGEKGDQPYGALPSVLLPHLT